MRLVGWIFVCLAVFQDLAAAPLHKVSNAVPGRYIVVLDGATPASEHANAMAGDARGKLVHVYSDALNGFSVQMNEQAALALSKRPGVAAVWEVPPAPRPADTQFGPPVGLDRIDQREMQLNGTYTYTMYTAAPVTIYVVDTGVDARAEFGSRLVSNINFSTNAAGVRDPNDYTDYGLPLNDVWHGTATAVLAAGAQNGVAKWAKIANVRVLAGTGGTYDDVVAGINWVTQQRNARPTEFHVANASFGDQRAPYAPADAAFRTSIAAGVAWVFSAGNDAIDACNFYPASLGSLSGAITVGAMHAESTADVVTTYSNQGPCVDIYVPSEVEWGDPDTIAGGTSAAAPHVAGVFAIRWAASTTSSSAEIEGLVKGLATTGTLTNIWGTSNNLLLYSLRPKRRSVGS
jgi:subtilisin family serine protease